MKSSEHILKVISLIITKYVGPVLTVIWVHEWPLKVQKYPGPFTHILLGLRSDQHLTRFNRWEEPVWAQSASAHFKLNLIPSIVVKLSDFS